MIVKNQLNRQNKRQKCKIIKLISTLKIDNYRSLINFLILLFIKL